MATATTAGAVLTIDLDAIAANFHAIAARLEDAECAAVVKADAYGLGLDPVARTLANAGCRRFFVALAGEGVALRTVLPKAEIYVLNGLAPGTEEIYRAESLTPVLNTTADVAAWNAHALTVATAGGPGLAAILHVDTGMSRLGLTGPEFEQLAAEPDRLAGLDIVYVMSHLACADEPDNPMNAVQRERFATLRARMPGPKASLANSAGVFLGPAYHFDLGRPGIALFGGAPIIGQPNPMSQVIRLQGKIVQLRDVDSPQTVGYGATYRLRGPARIATVAVGYADGYLRSLSNRGKARIGAYVVPVVGRVSMDLITLDITDVPSSHVRPGDFVDLIGPDHTLDDLAHEAGTIAYEILIRLGERIDRVYLGGPG